MLVIFNHNALSSALCTSKFYVAPYLYGCHPLCYENRDFPFHSPIYGTSIDSLPSVCVVDCISLVREYVKAINIIDLRQEADPFAKSVLFHWD